ncbi:MAG: bifunctional (p)ppGpp synthetase/guanosine-3',5'-bis(diphosphate) 3'-pyrophosphohydrolase [Eubacteriales bacterium]|nr:bifunctional (p)ppGpp synthetase/guanosine-3',5'-bis(diphosphate) 3'-pyrophosphohydrolase [Clostridiales bacterium]MDY5733008.1 bifunctional (p)ppGpp synthetase/guanosine-3',5'-bis(diphosphate) 3'-pyrophosphohydrolase [Eubacteriales bacterium]
MDELINMCAAKYSPEEMEMLKKAIDFASEAHKGQRRESGEPYIMHPIAVAKMLFEMSMDENTVIAGLLHDTVEDNPNITVDIIRSEFGDDVANMVDGVTKLTKSGNAGLLSKEDRQAENLRKMFMAIANDVRVVIIKLADRLHNMRTLEYCDGEKRIRKAHETLEVYAPLAHRFGMGAIKCELEDLSFEYLYPEEAKKLKNAIEPQKRERMQLLEHAMSVIKEQLAAIGIEAEVSGRPKHLYSIYKKVVKQNVTVDKIYDLIAIRVIVHTVNDCYAALGVIHSIWPPMPGRFKDYIAMPKTNKYRSLHTTLFGDNGMPFEVQIRTQEMHRAAEYGIAAHWMYKEGRTTQDDLDSKVAWLREALEYENLADTTREFVENIRKDFFSDFVFVLTPKGEIIDLPTGSTPVDFAYRIHTNVGNHTQHAKVNGAMVKLEYKLKNHDVVEIITSPQATPSRDWLSFVKTQQAKAKIRNWFKKANREENIQKGKEMLQEAMRRQSNQYSEAIKPEYFDELLQRYSMTDIDDIYAAIGYGGLTTRQIVHPLIEHAKRDRQEQERLQAAADGSKGSDSKPSGSVHGIRVVGQENMAVRFAGCCTPLPGDEIIGYITRGRGVSVHRRDCENAEALLRDADRIIQVEWATDEKTKYPVNITILATERVGLLMSISQMLMNMNINLRSINANQDSDDIVTVKLTFDVNNAEHLESILKNLKKVDGVTNVFRTN